MGSSMLVRQKIEQPCAACRLLHRKCNADCVLAPYFPTDEPEKFARVHKVFGASNVIKILQTVEDDEREDAVKSMVYEAYARIRDPVYGSTSALFYLQTHVNDLSKQLETTRAQILELRMLRDELLDALLDVSQPSRLCYPAAYTIDTDACASLDLSESMQYSSACCRIV